MQSERSRGTLVGSTRSTLDTLLFDLPFPPRRTESGQSVSPGAQEAIQQAGQVT